MSVATLPLLNDLQGAWRDLQVELIGGVMGPLPDVYPFLSVSDLKRLVWHQQGGSPRWAPERTFIGIRKEDGRYRPLEFHWMAELATLADPLNADARVPAPQLVDEAGNRKPISPVMVGGLLLEAALAPELQATGTLPRITIIPLDALMPAEPESLTLPLLTGFYQLYFPWISAPAQVLDAARPTAALTEAYAAVVPYLEDRTGRTEIVQRALAKGVAGPSVSMNTLVRMRWTLPPPTARPASLESTFYALRATEALPFLRYFPAAGKGAPLLKLGLQKDGTPLIDDEQVFALYMNQPAPAIKSAVIMARVPLSSPYVERGSAFTIYMFEDGTSDITLEVPQRGATYVSTVATEAERLLPGIIAGLGFSAGTEPTLRDLHATYNWTHPDPKRAQPLSIARLQSRVVALTPFLDTLPVAAEGTALATFVWRAVSNYESETAQFAYITQMIIRRGEEGAEAFAQYAEDLMEKFGITREQAEALLERWHERRGKAVAPAAGAGAGALAVPKHNTGATIAISGAHPAYRVEIQGVDSYTELQRAMSVIGVLLGAAPTDLVLSMPALVVQEQVAKVEVAEAVQEEAVEAMGPPVSEELDPEMAALMAELGFGSGDLDAEEEVEPAAPVLSGAAAAGGGGAAPAPAPNVEAAMAEVEQECGGLRWQPGESAIKLPAEYYMAKLKATDKVLFGYSYRQGGKLKGYSKSCQFHEGRQPNIMSLAEYARVKRCYAGQVRFVDLPPQKPADLEIPGFEPGMKYSKDRVMDLITTEQGTGRPIWAIYGYENKTRPGEYNYLLCAELWCDRDNLPLIPAEYAGTQGRGFSKEPNSCPFCGGRTIEELKAPKPGESVIVRTPKTGTGKLHKFIGTMSRTAHPDGYPLPCCDTVPGMLMDYMKAKLASTLQYGKDIAGAEAAEAEGEVAAAANDVPQPPPEAAVALAQETRIDYRSRLTSMQAQYILGGDKVLDAGKIGILPAALDIFFGQDSPRALESRGIRPTFVDGAIVFVRVGVDNRMRQPGLNLFAGLAPLLGFDSAEEFQRDIYNRRMVRAFEAANYGTLVHEFAARSTLTDAQVEASLQRFAAENGYQLGPARPHVVRLYKAWTAFKEYIADDRAPKQVRHFEHLLANPGTIAPRGLLLAILERSGDNVHVVCPTFGIPPASMFGDVPIAFLIHDRRSGTWEPIVLYNNTKDAVIQFNERAPELESLPPPMKISLYRWLREWRSSSQGCGRPSPPPHVWTPDRDSSGLPRLSQLRMRIKGNTPAAVVRDRSNRLAGVLFATAVAGQQLFVPCLDDGALVAELPRVYEVEMIPPAPLSAYLRFYTDLAIPALNPVRLLLRDQIVGFQVAAGTMIPVEPTPVGGVGMPALPTQQVDEFVWERDAAVLRAPNAPAASAAFLEESTASVEEQLAEAYQHLRLSMSNWLLRDGRGPALKQDLARLLKSAVPLYEKRKRMDIRLESLVREWINAEKTEERRAMALLRTDCLTLGEGDCKAAGACSWGGGRCMIHAPYRTEGTDPVRIMVARLSDELLRYAGARRELLEGSVPTIRTPRGVVRVGDEIYMAIQPRETAAGVLERLGFTGQIAMTFPEEMLRFEGAEEEGAAAPALAVEAEVEGVAPVSALPPLPAAWTAAGFQIPSPAPNVEDVRRMAFVAATGLKMSDIETRYLPAWRKRLGLSDPDRPFSWAVQDFYVFASMFLADFLFVRPTEAGGLVLDRWVAIPKARGAAMDQKQFIVLWGPLQLVVSKGKTFRFLPRDLPADLQALLDGKQPMSDEAARGYLDTAAPAAPAATAVQPKAPALSVQPPPPQPAGSQESDAGQPLPPAPAPAISGAAAAPS
jgi:hypothetical protein